MGADAQSTADDRFFMPLEGSTVAKLPEGTSIPPEYLAMYKSEVLAWMGPLFRGEMDGIMLPAWVFEIFTREEITEFEARGIIFSGVNADNPEGGIYVKSRFSSSLDIQGLLGEKTPDTVQAETIDSVYATGALRGVVGLITDSPSKDIPEDLPGLRKIPVNSLVAAVYKDGQWTKSHAFPDGQWVVPGMDNAGWQYAQSCFEGMVAQINNGRITIFRPEENARRFQKSCEAIKIPPVPIEQFLQSILVAVKRNRRFIPEDGSLYIRPFAVGLQEGLGVKPAAKNLFVVNVTPFKKYVAATSIDEEAPSAITSTSVKAIDMNRGAHGGSKVAPNYSPTYRPKTDAKREGFGDVMMVNDRGEIQELSSSNIVFVKKENREGKPTLLIKTPPLSANILPGITRSSLMELLRDPVIQQGLNPDFDFEVIDTAAVNEDNDLPEFDGAFGCGTAWGMARIDEIRTTKGEDLEFNKDQEVLKFITDLHALLMNVRKGKVPGYENWAVEVPV